ncbi:hypothetical protein [Rufibacter immobilis]|uniref:hypothetical protein n=1 Tax=Rufibacter immobilis TaxID=1348778 RepID=UPI0011CE711B|nr:hypothetical protein [Rufibacter immobilis]
MKYISILFLIILISSCKKDPIDLSPKSLITRYNWYPYKITTTFYSEDLKTVYRVQSAVLDSCYQAGYYKFYSDGKVDRHFPCNISPKMVTGTWRLSSDSIISVSVGFLSSATSKLLSINNEELETNTKIPYHIYSSSAPPEFGIQSTTTNFRHK